MSRPPLGRIGAFLAALSLAFVTAPAAADWVEPWSTLAGPSGGPPAIWGRYDQGCIGGAVALDLDGPGFQVIYPQRRRNYGHPETLDFVRDLGAAMQALGHGPINVADIGQVRGGPITGHASHESGLDVDVWYRLDLAPLPVEERRGLGEVSAIGADGAVDPAHWGEAQVALVRLAAEDPRIARIFVHAGVKADLCARDWPDRDWLRVLVPEPAHDRHMHVRLNCPADQPGCEGQAAPPAGTGCAGDDDPGDLGPDRLAAYGSPGQPRPPGVLPPACGRLFTAPSVR